MTHVRILHSSSAAPVRPKAARNTWVLMGRDPFGGPFKGCSLWGILTLLLLIGCRGNRSSTNTASEPGGADGSSDGSAGAGGQADAGAQPGPDTGGSQQGQAFDGAVGGECDTNAECADSPAAQELENIRCAGQEVYCLDQICHAQCLDPCVVARSDINPCTPPRLCVKVVGSLAFCSIKPAPCAEATDCPDYLPPTADGGQAAWACQDGVCEYPGLEYATH